MSDSPKGLQHLFRELKRRKVYRVGVVYLVASFVVWQVADYLFGALAFPDWTLDFVVVLSVLGFPIAVILAWAFEVTPEGVRRTDGPGGGGDVPGGFHPGWWRTTLVGFVALLLLIGAGVAGSRYLDLGNPAAPESRLGPGVDEPGRTRSVAVLPFENLSGNEDNEYFTQGIHEAILTALADVGDLLVTSRTSVLRYTEDRPAVPRIASELGVSYLVEGSVQRADDRVLVTVQLIDADQDRHLWAESFDRRLTADGVFELQAEVARRIATSLQATLSPNEVERIEQRPTGDLAAYDLYLRGQEAVRRSADESIDEAVGLFHRALEQDPDFALARAALADAYLSRQDLTGLDAWSDSAYLEASRALVVDPNLPEGYMMLAEYYMRVGDLAGELRELRRALELRPSYSRAASQLSRHFADRGRLDVALCWAERAVRLEPTRQASHMRLAYAYNDLGDVDEAYSRFREILGMEAPPAARVAVVSNLVGMGRRRGDRDQALRDYRRLRAEVGEEPSPPLLRELAATEAGLGMLDSARLHLESATRRSDERNDPEPEADLEEARVLLNVGEVDRARAELLRVREETERALEGGNQGFFPHLTLATVSAALGDEERALEQLRQAVDRGFRIAPWLSRFEGLEGNPEYDALRTRLWEQADSMRTRVEEVGCETILAEAS